MAEYKNGFNYRGNMSVEKEDYAPDVQTGRAVFVDEDKYTNDASYKAKVDKCIAEGFHWITEGDTPSGGGGGTEPLIVSITRRGATAEECPNGGTTVEYSHSWQEIYDALASGTPAYLLSSASSLDVTLEPLIGAYYDDEALVYIATSIDGSISFETPTVKTYVQCGNV